MATLSQILTEFWPEAVHSGQDLGTLEKSYKELVWVGPGNKPSLGEIKSKEAEMDALISAEKRRRRQVRVFRKTFGDHGELDIYYALTRGIIAVANGEPLPQVFDNLVTELQVARSVG